jgi:hypothetical protein
MGKVDSDTVFANYQVGFCRLLLLCTGCAIWLNCVMLEPAVLE